MKLATALSERSDIQRRLSELSTRLENNSRVQDGEEPAENPEMLLRELDGLMESMEELIARINLTNSKTVINGQTLTELLAKRDCLGKKYNMLMGFMFQCSELAQRATHSEIKIRSTISVPKLRKITDALSKELRQLDETIQEANWTTELM